MLSKMLAMEEDLGIMKEKVPHMGDVPKRETNRLKTTTNNGVASCTNWKRTILQTSRNRMR